MVIGDGVVMMVVVEKDEEGSWRGRVAPERRW